MQPRVPLPDGLGRAFSVRAARSRGAPRATVDAPDLARPFHGVRARAAPEPASDAYEQAKRRSLAAMDELAQVLSPGAYFTGPSAALLLNLPLPGIDRGPLHVGVSYPRTPPRRPGIQGRRFREHLVTTTVVRGLRVTDPPTTWASLGTHLATDDLVAVADSLLWVPRHPGGYRGGQTRDPLCTKEDLRDVLARGEWRGARSLREALNLAGTGSASRPETLLRLLLKRAGCPEPQLNVDIHDDAGVWLANADLVFREHRVCVEYQGAHHRSAQHYSADLDRRALLAEAGWTMVEVSATHLFRTPAELVRRVLKALGRSTSW